MRKSSVQSFCKCSDLGRFLLVVVFSLFFTRSLFAETDPFEPRDRMPEGPFQGQELDTSERRSIRILKKEDGETWISGFYHEGKFWIAKIPEGAVEQIYWLRAMKWMPVKVGPLHPNLPVASHSLLRFKMKEGKEIELTEQTDSPTPEKRNLKDLVHAIDAIPAKGDPFLQVISRGVLKNFAAAYRFHSLEEAAFDWITIKQSEVEQIPLNYTEAEKQSKLGEMIQRSNDVGHSRMFNTFGLNCTTELFDVIDRQSPTWLNKFANYTLRRSSYTPKTYLWLRGLISFDSWMHQLHPTLNEELRKDPEKPLDPVERKRKRETVRKWKNQRDGWEEKQKELSFKTQLCRILTSKLAFLRK